MNPRGKVVSPVYALMLLGIAFFAGLDTFSFAFAIADSGEPTGLAAGTFLIGTLAGGVGLVIAAFGAWSRWRGMSLIALVSILVVLPAAVLYGWQSVSTYWINTQHGMHFDLWSWASAILPPFLCLLAAALSWVRFRRLPSRLLSDATVGQGNNGN